MRNGGVTSNCDKFRLGYSPDPSKTYKKKATRRLKSANVSSNNIRFNKVRYYHADPYYACNSISSTYICTADIVAQKNIVYINQF